jgi:hypothetical protein
MTGTPGPVKMAAASFEAGSGCREGTSDEIDSGLFAAAVVAGTGA